MSFLDFFRRLGGGSETQTVTLSEAVSIVKGAAVERVSPIYPSCEKLCSAILQEVEGAKKAAAAIGKGSLDIEQVQYKIGLQMQRNFAERVPSALDAITPPKDRDYASFVRFHTASLGTIMAVAKISNDNRYLPFFLADEFGAFGRHMNEIVRLTDELGNALASKKEPVEQLDRAQKLENEIRALDRELASQAELKNEITNQKRDLDAEIASSLVRNKELEQEEKRLRQRIEEIRGLVSDNRKKITDQLSPFQRQFRKMQKRIIEKEDARMLNAYIDRAEDTIVGEVSCSGDYPSLRRILAEVKKALEKGELEDDARIRVRRLDSIANILAGSLIAPAKQLIDLEKELAAEENTLKAVLQKMSNIEAIRQRMEQNMERMAKIERNEEACRERRGKFILELESLVKEATGRFVRIDRGLG